MPLIECCQELLSSTGEATGLALAESILDRYALLDIAEKCAFFEDLCQQFSVDEEILNSAISRWNENRDDSSARALHFASEPGSQEIIRRLNRVTGGTQALVAMRSDLLQIIAGNPALKSLDDDFKHLLGSWFNRGFLHIRRIDWNTSAVILEKIIAYEAVHEINGWDDLRRRVAAEDRYLFGFFHPALDAEPLIFVEVALASEVPGAIEPILTEERIPLKASMATVAVFYSISNCQSGLRGISFGNFLIKQVVEELRKDFHDLDTFVTLSPVPGLRRWVSAQCDSADDMLDSKDRDMIQRLTDTESTTMATETAEGSSRLKNLAARYLLDAKSPRGGPADAVARFHLGNGARLENIHVGADQSERGLENSWGVMVNYLYRIEDIERNHERYANQGKIICSPRVLQILKNR